MVRSTYLRQLIVMGICSIIDVGFVEAQIYSSRDDTGTLILSDLPFPKNLLTTRQPVKTCAKKTSSTVDPELSSRFDHLIKRYSDRFSVQSELIRAIVKVESNFDPNARSQAGAIGLMQLMPATAKELGIRDPYDPAENLNGGIRYFKNLLTKFNNDEILALAAYNAGVGTVRQYGNQVPPFPETVDYINRVKSIISPIKTSPNSSKSIYKSYKVASGLRISILSNTPPGSRNVRKPTGWLDKCEPFLPRR